MKNIVFSAFLFFIFILGATPSFACSCASPGPSESMESADAVLIGKVTEETKLGEKWQIKVNRMLKGKVGKTISLYAAMLGTSCEAGGFKLDETYVFFLNKIDKNDLATNENDKIIEEEKEKIGNFEPIVCSWTSLLNDWKTDNYKKILSDYKDEKFLKVLNQGTKTKGRKIKN